MNTNPLYNLNRLELVSGDEFFSNAKTKFENSAAKLMFSNEGNLQFLAILLEILGTCVKMQIHIFTNFLIKNTKKESIKLRVCFSFRIRNHKFPTNLQFSFVQLCEHFAKFEKRITMKI